MQEQDKELAALKALAKEATPGPWQWIDFMHDDSSTAMAELRSHNRLLVCNFGDDNNNGPTEGTEPDEQDKAYIAAANPAAILSLISRIEQLEAERAEYMQAAFQMGEAVTEARRAPAVDLSGLTRYDYNHARDMMERAAEGDFYRVEDVWAALSAPVVREGKMTDELAIIKAVQEYLVDVVRSFGEVRCAAYISTWHMPEQIAAKLGREVLATGKGDAELGLRNDDLYGGARKPFVPDATPSQAWEGELPALPFHDPERAESENALMTVKMAHDYARKAIAAAVAGVDSLIARLELSPNAQTRHYELARELRSLSSNPVSLTEKDGWISVDERLPNQLRGVLVCHETDTDGVPDLSVAEGRLDPDGCWRVAATFYRMSGKPSKFELRETVAKVLYWKPLPEAAPHPASNGNGEKGGA